MSAPPSHNRNSRTGQKKNHPVAPKTIPSIKKSTVPKPETAYERAKREGACTGYYLRFQKGISTEKLESQMNLAKARKARLHSLIQQNIAANTAEKLDNKDWLDRLVVYEKSILFSASAKGFSPLAEAGTTPFVLAMSNTELEPATIDSRTTGKIIESIFDQGTKLRNELAPLFKKAHADQRGANLSPQMAISLLLPKYDGDVIRTIAVLAAATQTDADQAIKEGKSAGISDPIKARQKFSKLNRYLRDPDNYVGDNHAGNIYHYYGFMMRELTGGMVSKGVSSVTTNIFESDDRFQYEADYSGRYFAQALKKTISNKEPKATLQQICEENKCAFCNS